MKNPSCDQCNIMFGSMEVLSVHMKLVHNETDSMRIDRLSETVKSTMCNKSINIKIISDKKHVSFDCTECGLIFVTEEKMKGHNDEHHVGQDTKEEKEIFLINDIENISSDDDDITEEEGDINIEYEYSEEGNTFKGNKPAFVQAVIEVKELVIKQKGSSKIINNHKLSVKDVKIIDYGLEAVVEIFNGKLKGLARITIWGPSKSGKGKLKNKCTVMVQRYPGYEKSFSKMVSINIIKPLLDSHLKGEAWNSLF